MELLIDRHPSEFDRLDTVSESLRVKFTSKVPVARMVLLLQKKRRAKRRRELSVPLIIENRAALALKGCNAGISYGMDEKSMIC